MKSASPPLERGQLPWLLGCAALTTLPHALHQPVWLSLLSASIFGIAAWSWRCDRPALGRWILLLLVVGGSAGLFLEYRSLFGRDVGVATLVLMMSLKLLELKSRRDALVIVMLGYFLLLTHYFYSQTILTGIWLLFALWSVTATLVRLHGDAPSTTGNFRYAGTLILQALPFMLVLYLLFPRINGPLWGLPQDAHSGKTGLSDTMTPGSIANLVMNGEIAFRVRFDGAPPPREKLYWRGPVLERYDGSTWRADDSRRPPEQILALSPSIAYETTLEAHDQRWLLALDAPGQLPPDARLDGRLTVLAGRKLESRQRLRLSAILDYRLNVAEAPAVLAANLRLPERQNPRSRDLARQWRQELNDDAAIVRAALRMFAEQDFHYTLMPPTWGPNGIDDFLFITRRGFCEHYAAAFVVLMRHAGIPARVVGGYQGGELNPRDQFMVIRQSDAHAWSEVWLAGRGWVRVDPTAAVSPERIDHGIGSALPVGEPLPGILRWQADWLHDLRYRWEALNNAWNQYVLGYDQRRQRELLSRLGLPDADWPQMALLLGSSASFLLLIYTLWIFSQRPDMAPETRLWQRALRKIRVDCAPGETPDALLARLRREHPDLAQAFEPVVRHYLLAHYGQTPEASRQALRIAVDRLPRRRFL